MQIDVTFILTLLVAYIYANNNPTQDLELSSGTVCKASFKCH